MTRHELIHNIVDVFDLDTVLQYDMNLSLAVHLQQVLSLTIICTGWPMGILQVLLTRAGKMLREQGSQCCVVETGCSAQPSLIACERPYLGELVRRTFPQCFQHTR